MKCGSRDLFSILSLFALAGLTLGTIDGISAVARNGYLHHRMIEILFWTLANRINHHLAIFLVLASGNLLLYTFLLRIGVSPMRTVSFVLLPISVAGILLVYGLPYWPVLTAAPGRLLGKVNVMIYAGAFIFLVLFLLLWYAGLRKPIRSLWQNRMARSFSQIRFIAAIGSLGLGLNLLDRIDWSDRPTPGWNLILISIDTLRADRLGCYGYGSDVSPSIDAFASSGIRFERAISQSSWTLPSHASLFSGLYPSVHGAVSKKRSVLPSTLLLAEVLRNAGYHTTAFTGGGYLNPVFGFRQGFMEYRHLEDLDDEEVWRAIDDGRDGPFFLFLHTYRVHNYQVPDDLVNRLGAEYKDRFRELDSIMTFLDRHLFTDLDEESARIMDHLQDRYALSIASIDRHFEAFLKGLDERGLLANTLIVFLSDHGEEFGEHGRAYHGGTLYHEQLHVPLLMKVPGILRPAVIPEIVELMDVYPTILEALGLPPQAGIDGRSLVPLIEGRDHEVDRVAFSEISSEITEKYAVCDSASKLIYSPVNEKLLLPGDGQLMAFSLTWGPVWRESPMAEKGGELADSFRDWYARMRRVRESRPADEEVTIDPALEEELRALGYAR